MWWMNGPHLVDRLRRIVGSPIVSVKAKVSNEIYGYCAADSGMAMLHFENGVVATIIHAGYRFGIPPTSGLADASQAGVCSNPDYVGCSYVEAFYGLDFQYSAPLLERKIMDDSRSVLCLSLCLSRCAAKKKISIKSTI